VGGRTDAPAVNDRTMWRRLLARVHPDQGGSDALFVWCQSLREYLSGDEGGAKPASEGSARHTSHESSAGQRSARSSWSSGRIPFDNDADFEDLTVEALSFAETAGEPYAGVLALLWDCEEASASDAVLYRQQKRGCSYKQLAAIAYRVGMTKQQRQEWYAIAEAIPLSMRHASHILSRL
jgi:hypothetical protein